MLNPAIRSRLEARFGKPIRYSKDCESLAKSIEKNGQGRISITTLKRMLGFARDIEKPRIYTLDVLAAYLGYTDWSSLLADTEKPAPDVSTDSSKKNSGEDTAQLDLQQQLLIIFTTRSIDFNKAASLCRQYGKSPVITQFIAELIHFAGKTKNLQFLKQLFTLPHVFDENLHEQGHLYYIGQTLGVVLRSHPDLADELSETYAKAPAAQLILIEWFVDEDYINGYYGQLLDRYHEEKNKKTQDRIFYFAMKYTQCMQAGDLPGEQQWYRRLLKISPGKQLHPIPAGRYYGILIAENAGQSFGENTFGYAQCLASLCDDRYENAIHFLLYLFRYLFRKQKTDWISGLTTLFEEVTLGRPGREKTYWGTKTENQLLVYLAYGKYLDGQTRKAREYISKVDPNLFEVFIYKQMHTDYFGIRSMIG